MEITEIPLDVLSPSSIYTTGEGIFEITFRNDLGGFHRYLEFFDRSRRSPIMQFEKPVNRYGQPRYAKHVTSVLITLVSPNVKVIHLVTDDTEEQQEGVTNE